MPSPRSKNIIAYVAGIAIIGSSYLIAKKGQSDEKILNRMAHSTTTESSSKSPLVYSGSKNLQGKMSGYGCAYFMAEFEQIHRLTNGSPSLYCGEWSDGQIHGKGSLSVSDGNLWDGNFSQGKLNGKYFFSTKDGFVTIGNATDNNAMGSNIWIGDIELVSGDFNECGPNCHDSIMMSEDGKVYVGETKDGKKHGVGFETIINSHTKIDTKGKWDEGILEDAKITIYPTNLPEFDKVEIVVKDKFIDSDYKYSKFGTDLINPASDPNDPEIEEMRRNLFEKLSEYMQQSNQPVQIEDIFVSKSEKVKSLKTDFGDVLLSKAEGEFQFDQSDQSNRIWEGTLSKYHPGSGIVIKLRFKDGQAVDREVAFPDNRRSALFKNLPFHDTTFKAQWTNPEEWASKNMQH